MNLKLEELRKRLLDPTGTAPPSPPETIYKRSADQISPLEPPVVTKGTDAAELRSTPLRDTQQPTAQADSLAGTVLQYVGENADQGKDIAHMFQFTLLS